MMMHLAHYLIGVAQMGVTVLFGSVFLQRRRLAAWRVILYCLVAPLFFTAVNLLQIPWLNTLMAVCISVVLTGLVFSEKIWRVFLVGFMAVVLILLCEFITMIVCTAVLTINVAEMMASELLAIISTSLSTLTFFVVVLIIRMVAQQRQAANNTLFLTNRFTVVILPVISILIGYYVVFCSTRMQEAMVHTMGLVLYLAFLLADIVILFGTESDRQRMQLRQDKDYMESQAVFLTQLTAQQEEHLQELRTQAHDYKNHLLSLQLMLGPEDKGKEAEATRNYLQDMLNTLEVASDFSRIQNKALEILLNKTSKECSQNHIQFSTHLEYTSFAFLSYQDLSALLFNALDNAVFACRQMEPTCAERYINFTTRKQNEMVYIHVVNSKTNVVITKNGGFLSTKTTPGPHAIGLKNIRRIARKYGGDMMADYTEDVFRLYIHLPFVQTA